jgi:hypothetical protein
MSPYFCAYPGHCTESGTRLFVCHYSFIALADLQGSFQEHEGDIEMALMVMGVMFFQKMLEATKAVYIMSEGFSTIGFPHFIILISIPFIVGLLTGITIAFVGITFPILLPIFQTEGHFLSYLMLAYASGYCGVILSPMHLCLILTKDYFNAELNGVYRLLWLPAVSVLCVGLVIAIISG